MWSIRLLDSISLRLNLIITPDGLPKEILRLTKTYVNVFPIMAN